MLESAAVLVRASLDPAHSHEERQRYAWLAPPAGAFHDEAKIAVGAVEDNVGHTGADGVAHLRAKRAQPTREVLAAVEAVAGARTHVRHDALQEFPLL
jgi:hypothetical protein